MKAHTSRASNLILLSMGLYLLTGCAISHRPQVDVSSPSNKEFIESDVVVDVPLSAAYQNILNRAPACWCSPFSGQVLAYPNPTGPDASQISYVVPGKFLGSKVELATVRLYPHDENRTRIVGSSFVYPGTWQMTELAGWASGTSASCTVVTLPDMRT